MKVSKGILVTHPTKHHYSDVATRGPYELIQMNWPSLHSGKTEPGTHDRTTCYTNMFAGCLLATSWYSSCFFYWSWIQNIPKQQGLETSRNPQPASRICRLRPPARQTWSGDPCGNIVGNREECVCETLQGWNCLLWGIFGYQRYKMLSVNYKFDLNEVTLGYEITRWPTPWTGHPDTGHWCDLQSLLAHANKHWIVERIE